MVKSPLEDSSEQQFAARLDDDEIAALDAWVDDVRREEITQSLEATGEPDPDLDPDTLAGYPLDLRAFLGEAEPDDDDKDDWIVRGLVPAGAPAFLAGDPKTQKTFIMESLAIAIAAGKETWCGFPIVNPGRVLVFPLEDTNRTTRIRLWQLARGYGIEYAPDLAQRLEVVAEPFYFDDSSSVNRLRRTLERFEPSVVFMDSLSRIHRGDESSKGDIQRVTTAWTDLCRDANCTIVVIHHFNGKGASRDTRGVGHRLRGSSDWFALARHVVGVGKVNGGPLLEVRTDGNLLYQPDPFSLELVGETRADGRKSLRFVNQGPVSEAAMAQTKIEVLRLVSASQSGVGARALRAAIDGDNARIDAAAQALADEGRIHRRGPKSPWVAQP